MDFLTAIFGLIFSCSGWNQVPVDSTAELVQGHYSSTNNSSFLVQRIFLQQGTLTSDFIFFDDANMTLLIIIIHPNIITTMTKGEFF